LWRKLFQPDHGVAASSCHDPQIEIWRVSAVLAQEEFKDWQAKELGNIFFPSGGGEARAGSTVFQEALI
jgi:hypothetical protein